MKNRHIALASPSLSSARAPPRANDDVDQLVQEEMTQRRIPGLALAMFAQTLSVLPSTVISAISTGEAPRRSTRMTSPVLRFTSPN